ncbi:MAG: TIM barrel protein, partial [Planctomycetota bacterium]
MLLTCNVSSIGQLLRGNKQRPAQLKLLDVPAYVKDELGLHGLSISTDLLVGSTPDRLNAFRERADKAGCACLLLIESEPQPLGDPDDEKGFAAIDRGKRVLQAASLLGCNSAAIRVEAADDDESMERVVDRIREILPVADKLDIYLALRPHEGLTADPERLTDTIKKIGGFRVATLPDLQVAAGQDDPAAYLRRITPYASAVLAQTFEFAEVQAPEIDDDKPA